MKKYFVGWQNEAGNKIIDGPIRKEGKTLWVVQCGCGNIRLSRADTLSKNKQGCAACGHAKTRILDSDIPAAKKAWKSIRNNAASRGLEVAISFETFYRIAKENCFYCGSKPYERKGWKSYHKTGFFNGLDRKNNNAGYISGNVVSCCYICNRAKADLTIDEWTDWRKRIGL